MPIAHHVRLARLALVILTVTAVSVARAAEDSNGSPETEQELLAVLQSDAPDAEKAVTCKKLAIYGSSDAVPDLAKLLPNERLSSWARIALEAIPGPEADDALLKAMDSVDGRQLIGMINSIGVRRNAGAVDMLAERVQDSEPAVAAAAAVALGRIGNAPATEALRTSLTTTSGEARSAIAEGCVLCAERLLSEGESSKAAEIYDEVRAADVPKQRVVEATRGAILARKLDGIPILLEQFRSPDNVFFQLALSTAREFPGDEVDQALADEMASATPDRAALIVQAMADRPDTVVLAAVLGAAEQGDRHVRLSAIDALARVGDADCLEPLLGIALEDDAEVVDTAKGTLANLPGDTVDSRIVTLLADAEGSRYPLLIEVVGRRRIDAVPLLLDALDHSDDAVRSAALIALGETVGPDRLSVLISQVVSPQRRDDAPVALQALRAASIRMPDREACAEELTTAIERSSSAETKRVLLEILGAMGGPGALTTIEAAAKSTDPVMQDTSTRLLGEWMTEDAAPVLLDVAETAGEEKYRVRAMRGYIRIARQFDLPAKQRVEMCGKALDTAWRIDEQKLVLDVLKRYPSVATLKLAISAMEIPGLKPDAVAAGLAIAKNLQKKGTDVDKLLSGAGLEVE